MHAGGLSTQPCSLGGSKAASSPFTLHTSSYRASPASVRPPGELFRELFRGVGKSGRYNLSRAARPSLLAACAAALCLALGSAPPSCPAPPSSSSLCGMRPRAAPHCRLWARGVLPTTPAGERSACPAGASRMDDTLRGAAPAPGWVLHPAAGAGRGLHGWGGQREEDATSARAACRWGKVDVMRPK